MSCNSARSGNSGRQSKRSANSNQSTSGDDRTSGGKRRKADQKTLGVAWGANSKSSSMSSFRSAPFSDFGSYMVAKNKKLQDQFAAEAGKFSTSGGGGDGGKRIFEGVAIFVDGFTIPSSQELRAYMLKHGGRFENYFSRHHVTHIICSNLPDSKIKNLRSFRGGLPVVKPMWVLDSVAANKLLSWIPYQLDQVSSASRSQTTLSAFFALKNSPIENFDNETTCYEVPEVEESTLKSCSQKVDAVSEATESEQTTLNFERHNEQLSETISLDEKQVETSGLEKALEDDMDHLSNARIDNLGDTPDISGHAKLFSVGFAADNKYPEGSPSLSAEPSKRGHSTLEDPNFVGNYFKSSRLHFIGTWRTRYRKRFPSTSRVSKSSNPDSPTIAGTTAVIHVDMDCFFVAVVIRKHPELRDKPVAICHSDNPKGTAEISSANYPARDFGIKAGIFVRDAKARCPHLVILPYNFEAYQEVADQFYTILHKHCDNVQAVSCDEAFLEVPYSDENDPEALASSIRKDIWETTGCTASAGIASNMLMARLATRNAKPDGQCNISSEKVEDYLFSLPIKSLPGIGHVLEEKLKRQHIQTCGQLRMVSKESLQRDFGTKTGEMLWSYSRGLDNRLVGTFQESKSVGAEVNWGVRFKDLKDIWHFLGDLCKEVSLRLQGCGLRGRTFTLKLKKRKKDAMEPAKYMGCGDCENLSHSTTIPVATDDVEILNRITKQLFGLFCIDVTEIRGVGLHASKLKSGDPSGLRNEWKTLHSWLSVASTSSAKKSSTTDPNYHGSDGTSMQSLDESVPPERQSHANLLTSSDQRSQLSELPPLSLIDMEVIENLPPEILLEMDKMYSGKLMKHIAKKKGGCSTMGLGSRSKGVERHSSFSSDMISYDKTSVANEAQPNPPVPKPGYSSITVPDLHLEKPEFLPRSLSQVDPLVLQELPEDVRADILKALPVHRASIGAAHPALPPHANDRQYSVSLICDDKETTLGNEDFSPYGNLWIGDPPWWVENFKTSECLILRKVAEYHGTCSMGNMSSILQRLISRCQQYIANISEGVDEGISGLSELMRQYVDLKIEQDIEEIHFCFRLLKRSASMSDIFQQVYDIVLPYLQVSVAEKYGGKLQI